MTTIAYRDGLLVADTQLTIGETKLKCTKISRLQKNLCIACAGPIKDESLAKKHFSQKDWMNREAPQVSKEFECILIWKGTPYFCEKNLYPVEIEHPFFAIGSGWKYAMAAMHAGDDARGAVKFASELDVYTNDVTEEFNTNEHQKEAKVPKQEAA
jgi:ATP-dependent protease HslVU (ClpYQ) peptidase subunit